MNKVFMFLALLLFCIGGVFASSVSVWQGQYYTGTTFNTGTYTFNFTIYDAETGGSVCFTNATSLTTGNWGQWRTEQSPWNSCNNASRDYFLNINIAGSDETPRRRLTVSDFLRRDAADVHEENITADYYFGDGSFLTGINGSGDITSVQGDDVYLYNGSNSGDVVLVFNETKLNNTIDSRASGDNSSWNQSLADSLYISQGDEGNLNVNSSIYSNSTTWWADLTSWLSGWLVNNGGSLEFNETKLNNTIDARDTDTHVAGTGYLYNDTTTMYLNETLLNNTIDSRTSGDNSSWNESYANGLYYSITNPSSFWNDSYATFNKTYADTLYADIGVVDTDTNASTACSSTEVLLGNGSCYDSSVFFDNTDTQKNATGYLYNDSTTIYLNETKLNVTIDNRENDTLGDVGACGNEQVVKWNISSSSWYCSDVAAVGAGDIDAVNTNGKYLTGGQTSGSVSLLLNESVLNGTISVEGLRLGFNSTYNSTYDALVSDNSSWNESYADTLYAPINYGDEWNKSYADTVYLNLSGQNANQNINISQYNFSANQFFGFLNASYILNAPWITSAAADTNASTACSSVEVLLGNGSCYDSSVFFDDTDTQKNASGYLYNDSTTLYLNETLLNATIDYRDTNETTRFDNLVGNCSAGDFIFGIDSSGNRICDTPAGGGDITSVQGNNIYIYNGSDSNGVVLAFNETKLNSTIDDRTSGDNSSWNETYADTLYAPVNYGDEWNKTYADTVYLNLSGENANQNINVSPYNLTAFQFFGNLNASYILNAPWITSAAADTNASTACSSVEVLLGNGSCYDSSVFFDDTDTTYSHLSNFTDDLGDRGYTSLSNFTNDLNFITQTYGNATYHRLSDFSISDYFTKTEVLGFSYYNSSDFSISDYYLNSNPFGFWNDSYATFNETYADTKYLQSYSETDPLWTGNQTNVAFTNIEETFEGNVTVEGIKLEVDSTNHRIYDNASCVIIQGDTSTMYIC